MSSYLDYEGLGLYHENNKNYIDSKIPTKTSELTNDSNFVNTNTLNTSLNTKSPKEHTHEISDVDGLQDKLDNYASKTDIPTLVAGSNITLTPNTNTNEITISSSGGTSYTLPVATSSALGGVKSGTDITVDSSGNVSVNDDSHNHVISNVDGLQSALNGKMNTKISNIELNSDGALANYGGFIDFHFNGSTDDYTSRIIEDASGQISMSKCSLKVQKEIYTYNNKLVPTIYSSTEPSSNLMNGLIWIG